MIHRCHNCSPWDTSLLKAQQGLISSDPHHANLLPDNDVAATVANATVKNMN